MRKRNAAAAVATAFVLITGACGREEPASLPDPERTGVPIELEDSPTPSIVPDAETGFAGGTAALTVTGAVNGSETYPVLGSPALWVPPPGEFAMTWTGPGGRVFELGGVSFTAQQPTSPERVLAFTIRSSDGSLEFRSEDGGCLVTISPALPDRMGGTFLCTAIEATTVDGSQVSVPAQGTFSAE